MHPISRTHLMGFATRQGSGRLSLLLTSRGGIQLYSHKAATPFRQLSSNSYDLAVIGGGPGGYVAAIKASQLGLKTVCIEKRGTLGGTCLNVGCIPSKALLNITHKFHDAQHNFAKMGIMVRDIQLDVPTMQKQKEKSVKGLTSGIEMLFKANKVDYQKGTASFSSPTSLRITPIDGSGVSEVSARNIIIATGSESSPMPGGIVVADEESVITSTGALSLQEAPKKMVVIGGGVIGLELGSVYGRLGTEIVVVEYMDRILPGLDGEVSSTFQKLLAKQGFNFMLGCKVIGVAKGRNQMIVEVENVKNGQKTEVTACKVLLSVGRRAYTEGLGLENIGIQKDKSGRIIVNPDLTVSNHPHIRAIGDVIAGPMLAHKAEEEGIAAAETIAGKCGHVNYQAIPSVVYTHPEVAGVGQTEDQLVAEGIEYMKGSFPFAANSRARTNDDADGMVKILTDKKTDRILGAWIVGPNAGELIQELVLGMEYGASSEDIARTCHAHPTLSEAIKEACLAAHGKPIHNVVK